MVVPRRGDQKCLSNLDPMTSKLELKLIRTKPCTSDESGHTYDPELDDVVSVLADVCELLEESGCVTFQVHGFGQEAWPVDIGTDLLTILEQLPSVATAINDCSAEFRLDFYEQRIQRFLTFERSGDMLIVRASGTNWQPQPESLTLPVDAFCETLEKLREDFLSSAAAVNPDLADHPWLHEWDEQSRLRPHVDEGKEPTTS